MKRVKLFRSSSYIEIEKEMNEFMQFRDVEDYDVRPVVELTSSSSSYTYYTGIVKYEEKRP